MMKLKEFLIRVLLRLLSWLGWEVPQPAQSRTTSKYIEQAKFVVREVEAKFPHTGGEFKRSQALRMMLNITNASERECAKAIEEAVELCLPR